MDYNTMVQQNSTDDITSPSRENSVDRDLNIFGFDKWIQDNGLNEIKDCLIDYNLNTLHTLDLYSTDALNMMNDDRIKSKPHLLPILMSSVIELQTQKISQPPSRKESPRLSGFSPASIDTFTPHSVKSTSRSRRSSKSRRASQTPFALTILEDTKLDDAFDNTELERRLSVLAGEEEVTRIKRVNFESDRRLSVLSGLNIRECQRNNFRMNSIDAYPQTIMHTLKTGTGATSKKNTLSLKAWIFNICFHVFLILYIYFEFIAQEKMVSFSWTFLALLGASWIVYTVEWIPQMLSNSWKPPRTVGDASTYDIETICHQIKGFIAAKPSIKWNVKCYHRNQEKQSGGRVETLDKNKEYSYNTCEDVSPPFPERYLKDCAFTTLTVFKTFQFGNRVTSNDYYHRSELFRQDHDNEDEYQYFAHWMELKDWFGDSRRTAKLVVQRDKEQSMRGVSKSYLAMFSCLMCSACYRAYASRRVATQNIEYIVLKEISL